MAGIIRTVDSLGRIVIPAEMREALGMEPGTDLEIDSNAAGEVILGHPVTYCSICRAVEPTESIRGVLICTDCISHIKKI